MTPIITAFALSPDEGKGLARDMRVRWALEEAGQPYEVRLLSFPAMKQPAHMAQHPLARFLPMRKAISCCSSRGHPAPSGRAPRWSVARRRECPHALYRLDFRGAQYYGAADR